MILHACQGNGAYGVKSKIVDHLNILIIESNPIMGAGLKACLEAVEQHWVIKLEENEPQELFSNDGDNFRVVLIGSISKEFDIIEIITSISSYDENINIIIANHKTENFALAQQYISLGVMGLIEQNARIDTYSEAIRAVSIGESFNIDIVEIKSAREVVVEASDYSLTKREKEVLGLISNGLSNKEIANYYTLSVRTVETHRKNIRHKTDAGTLSDLMQVAFALGIKR